MSTIFQHQQTEIQHRGPLRITRRFSGDQGCKLLVQAGESVSPVQIVAEQTVESGFAVIDVATELNIDPKQVEKYLTVQPGEMIRQGMAIAEKKKWLRGSDYVESHIQGEFIESYDGYIVVSKNPVERKLRAMLVGQVLHTIPGRGVVIESTGSRIEAAWSNGLENYGQLRVCGELANDPLLPEMIDPIGVGDIVAIGRIDKRELAQMVEDQGARGIIAGVASPEIFSWAKENRLPLVVTDGLGTGSMSGELFEILKDHDGDPVALAAGRFSSTGRPEIIMAQLDDDDGSIDAADSQSYLLDKRVTRAPLAAGQVVRVLRAPLSGQWGVVKRVYPYPRKNILNRLHIGADIELSDGTIRFVPDRNLDIIF